METDNQTEKVQEAKRSRLNDIKATTKRFFHHPNFNAVCGVVTIISLVFGVWSWKSNVKERQLTYYVSPTRTPIVQKGKLEKFDVTFQGVPIQGNLSSVEIQIWNAGKEPIRKEDVLRRITLQMQNNDRILQESHETTRDVIGLRTDGGSHGEIELQWDILEQGDGVKLQLIYNGDVKSPLALGGVIVGQRQFNMVLPKGTKTPWRTVSGIVVVMIIFWVWYTSNKVGLNVVFKFLPSKPTSLKSKALMVIAVLLLAFANLAIALYVSMRITSFLMSPITPPFGF